MQISDAKNNFNNINCGKATLTTMAFHEIHSVVHIVSDMMTVVLLFRLRFFSNEKFPELPTTLPLFHIATFSAVLLNPRKI